MGRRPGRPARPASNAAPKPPEDSEQPTGFPKVPGTPIVAPEDAPPPVEGTDEAREPDNVAPEGFTPDDEADEFRFATEMTRAPSGDEPDEWAGLGGDEAQGDGDEAQGDGDEAQGDGDEARIIWNEGKGPGQDEGTGGNADALAGLFSPVVDRLLVDVESRADRGHKALLRLARDYAEGRVNFQTFVTESTTIVARLEQDEADIANLVAIRQDPAEVWKGFQTPLIDVLRRLSDIKLDI